MSSFTPPLPPPLPAWPPYDERTMHSRLQPPLPPTQPPPPPPPGLAMPARASLTRSASDVGASFGSIGLVRSNDDHLSRLRTTTTSMPPPGFDRPSSVTSPHQQQSLPAFGRSELDLGSAQWGMSNSFGGPSSGSLTSSSAGFGTSSTSSLLGTHTTSMSSPSEWGVLPSVDIERKAVEILVDKTFGTDTTVNPTLVEWLDDPVMRWHVGSCFLNLRRDAIGFRDGTAFKNDYDILIARLAAHLMGAELTAHVASIEKKLTEFCLQRVALAKGDEYFVKRFVWACDGVRIIAEAATRTGNLGLSDDEVRDLCACVRSLVTALPPISRQLRAAKRLSLITESAGSLTVSASTSRSTTPTTSPVVSPTLSLKKDVKESERPAGTPAAAPSSWATVVTTTPVKATLVSQTSREVEDPPKYQFFEEAPELDGMKRVQVFRLKRHCTLQPKAALCPHEVSSAADHNPQSCPFSHSLLEVMTYSPLFKLFVCNDDRHYGEDAHERADCAFLHYDVGFSTEWMDDFAKGKRSYCLAGTKCVNKACLKSHSFEEMCWYNPWYKIQRCERGCTETSLACRFFHEGSGDRRYLELDDDHVGHAIEIPFVSRTHDTLIKKLKTLGL